MNIYSPPMSGGPHRDLEQLAKECEAAFKRSALVQIIVDAKDAPYKREYNGAGYASPLLDLTLPNGWAARWFRSFEPRGGQERPYHAVFVRPEDLAGWLRGQGVEVNLQRGAKRQQLEPFKIVCADQELTVRKVSGTQIYAHHHALCAELRTMVRQRDERGQKLSYCDVQKTRVSLSDEHLHKLAEQLRAHLDFPGVSDLLAYIEGDLTLQPAQLTLL